MKQVFATRNEAQVFADRLHTWLVLNDPEYARSVSIGQTLRWAIPRDEGDGTWSVVVKDRVTEAQTPLERTRIVQVVKDAT